MMTFRQFIIIMKNNKSIIEKTEGIDYFITSDGRKVDYLENPLDIPKRKEKKKIDFDIEISNEDDFDI